MTQHDPTCGRCAAVLRAIDEWGELNGYPPTLSEIGSMTGISSNSMIVYHVDELVARGHLRKTPSVARATTITDAGRAAVRQGVARG